METLKPWGRFRTVLLLALLAVFMSGCVGTRMGVSWPATGMVTIQDETKILVAYNNEIDVIDPSNGAETRLMDEEGDPIRDTDGNARVWEVNGNDYESAQFFTMPLRITVAGEEDAFLFPSYNERALAFDVERPFSVSNPLVNEPLGGAVLAEIVQGDGLLYVPFRNSNVAALDSETYERIWTFDTNEGVWAPPLLVDDVLYIASLDHFLYAVDAETGEAIWSTPVDLEGGIAAQPLLYEDHLYIGSFSHKLYKISLEGEIVAEYEARNWIWSTPVIYDGIVYITDLSGFVHAVDAADLSEVWSVEVAERGIRPAPIVTEDTVVVASRDGKLYWLSRDTGDLIFDREVDGRPEILSDMLLLDAETFEDVSQSLIIISTVDVGKLVAAFTLENGQPVWVYGR